MKLTFVAALIGDNVPNKVALELIGEILWKNGWYLFPVKKCTY
jgi:hypothetical protein